MNKNKKEIEEKMGDTPVSHFMNENYIKLKANYSIKGAIEIFKTHHVGGAPVTDFQEKIIGVISDYDLLIQAASRPLTSNIEFKQKIFSVYPESTLKEVLVILYKQKLKWMPVINQQGFMQGTITRIDVLHFIANH